MAAAGRVKRRDANQTVYAGFTLEEAVCVFAFNQNRSGLQAGVIAFQIVQNLIAEAVALRPAGVHAIQHVAPVLCFGSACTGMERENRIVCIVLAEQQRSQLAALQLIVQRVKALAQLVNHGVVIHLDGEVAQRQQILLLAAQVVIAFNLVLERLGALQDFLRLFRVVPEARLGGTVFQFFYLFRSVLEIVRLTKFLNGRLEIVQLLAVFFKFNECQSKFSSQIKNHMFLTLYYSESRERSKEFFVL